MVTFTKPTINADDDAWGGIINGDIDILNDMFVHKGSLNLYDGTSQARIGVGVGGSGNHFANIDLVGDDVYTTYGLRLIRADNGANSDSEIQHRGTGNFRLRLLEAGSIIFATTNSDRMLIDSAGRVAIGGVGDTNAILALVSTTMGFLPPRMTTTQRDAIASPPAGLIVYNNTLNTLQVRTASAWVNLH